MNEIQEANKMWIQRFHAAYIFIANQAPHDNSEMIRTADAAKDTLIAALEGKPWANE
jgi:hypothetical protein